MPIRPPNYVVHAAVVSRRAVLKPAAFILKASSASALDQTVRRRGSRSGMSHNPYAPPKAETEAAVPGTAVRRPVAVWLLILLLLAFALTFVSGVVRYAATVSAHWGEIRGVAPFMLSLVWRLALVAIFFAAAYGAFRGHAWSRWFGVVLIVAFAAYISLRDDTPHNANDAQRAGAQMARLVVASLLAWWAYVLAFSSKAKRYFSKSP
jgi:hypothetical protein